MRVTIDNRQRKVRLRLGLLRTAALAALSVLKLEGAELSLVFLGPRSMRGLNRRYRGIDRTTDVLSFPMLGPGEEPPAAALDGDPPEFLLGDIVIDPLRANEQAEELGHSLDEELLRLLVHGLVHLLGYDHEAGQLEARRMKAKEDMLLKKLSSPATTGGSRKA